MKTHQLCNGNLESNKEKPKLMFNIIVFKLDCLCMKCVGEPGINKASIDQRIYLYR